MAASDEEAKERCMEAYMEEKRKAKRWVYQSKKKVTEQFGRKMNEDINENRNFLWKEASNLKGEKMESCSRIKDGNGRLAHGEDEFLRILKENFEDLYTIYTQEQIAIHMCGFDGIQRKNLFGGEPIGRAEAEGKNG